MNKKTQHLKKISKEEILQKIPESCNKIRNLVVIVEDKKYEHLISAVKKYLHKDISFADNFFKLENSDFINLEKLLSFDKTIQETCSSVEVIGNVEIYKIEGTDGRINSSYTIVRVEENGKIHLRKIFYDASFMPPQDMKLTLEKI